MDSNKDEAIKCIGIAKEAIASGKKERALKFIKIAQRLNSDLSVKELLEACEKIGTPTPSPSQNGNHPDSAKVGTSGIRAEGTTNGVRNYTQEHVQLINQVKRNKDYYAILGVEKECSMEEIKKAYRKLSLKVHPDKNKAPGAEEAFKKVSKAFKCLSEEDSRRHYDQVGLADEYEHSQQHVRRRRRTGDFHEDEFDPDEIFRAFFGQTNVFNTSRHVYRTRTTGTQNRTEGAASPNFMVLIQLLPILLIVLLAYLPSSEPEYSLQKTNNHHIPRVTEKYGVEFFVKDPDFDSKFPVGSESRVNLEEHVIYDYKNQLGRYCHIELQRRQWSWSMPTPHCDKLRSYGWA